MSSNVISQFPNYVNTDHRTSSHRSSGETHSIPSSTGPFKFVMPDLPETGPSPNVESGVEPSATLGGTAIPFHENRFGSSHIAPSTPALGGSSHTQPRPNTSVPFH